MLKELFLQLISYNTTVFTGSLLSFNSQILAYESKELRIVMRVTIDTPLYYTNEIFEDLISKGFINIVRISIEHIK